MMNIQYDNTAKVKAEADRNENLINRVDAKVKGFAKYNTPECIIGKNAYNVNGCKVGKVEAVSRDSLVIRGQWQRVEEWKPTPWTAEEKEAYWNHRKVESERIHNQTQIFYYNLREKAKLRKEFTGR